MASSSSVNDKNYPRWNPNLTPRRSPFPLLGNKEKNDDIDHLEEIKNKNSSFEAAGVFLTWEDLWVTTVGSSGSGEDTNKAIIQGLNGYAQHGEILAIMGPSGSGKSTLLYALAGRLASNTRHSGLIQVNGQRQTLAFGTSGICCPR
ncbi:hypothetical protein MKW98_001574 [Papaver atlanticum]|uniref:ABC transporter domain-containing protein n=1 Tax=Papaver atlanticum TaxID=357466 RepID=A0AAD4S862_9MAGN|nr:hypothetical protein MKW98_001574 [Papaver atlanticum]